MAKGSKELDVPFRRDVVDTVIQDHRIDFERASIRQMVAAVSEIEKRLSCRYLRMEFGIPGFDPIPIGPESEIGALRRSKVPGMYAPIAGLPILKEEGAKFFKNFLDIDIPADCVIPTTGSMQGGFLAQAVAGRCDPKRDRILYIDPCFSVHRMQRRFLGLKEASVDLYDRTQWLDRAEAICAKGDVAAVIYSTPNNPTWVILTENELQRLGEICTKYDVIAIEDQAYFGMDMRKDYSVPRQPPYPPTVARHTPNYVFLLSGSKIFSYAGQRVALAYLSPSLVKREFPGLETWFGETRFFDAYVMSGLYCTTTGVAHTPQYGLAGFLAKANKGEFNFIQNVSEYSERAKVLKSIFLSNGFHLVYAEDVGEPLADGFFFTFAYPGMTGAELVGGLLYYGISATALTIACSSRKEAVRACVSLIGKEDYKLFESRIKKFAKDHPMDVTRESSAHGNVIPAP
ncbi:MAG TPA: pyridoxal phosphate-dependent aminotransferase [Bdellovibrionota bacterium]|nr:pyridoxal phosphate-dependent aminotransferase [Bdellovibrionota bacterium]